MGYLFDNDVISAVLRPRPLDAVIQRLASMPRVDQCTSAITLGELVYGAKRKGRDDLLKRMQEFTDFVPVLPFDEEAANIFGDIKSTLESNGIPLAEPDLRIAAIAIATNLTLATGNVRHFARVPGLTLENWLG
ncbi:MAG: PIN domain-containing protein [Chloroflexota bacterium]